VRVARAAEGALVQLGGCDEGVALAQGLLHDREGEIVPVHDHRRAERAQHPRDRERRDGGRRLHEQDLGPAQLHEEHPEELQHLQHGLERRVHHVQRARQPRYQVGTQTHLPDPLRLRLDSGHAPLAAVADEQHAAAEARQ